METVITGNIPLPAIPKELSGVADSNFADAHAIMSSYDKSHVLKSLPDKFTDAETLTNFIELKPSGHDYDDTRAVVVPYPLGVGDEPRMYMALEMVQRSLKEDVRIIGIPNNTYKESNYSFETPELRRINDGSFDPLAEKIGKFICRRGVINVDILGYGQGACVAGYLIEDAKRNGYFDVRSALLAESPNITTRPKQSFEDYAVSRSSNQFFNAVTDAQIPALNDIVGFAKGRQMPGFVARSVKYIAGLRGEENKALRKAMAEPRMLRSIKSADKCESLLLARAVDSLVCPSQSFEYLRDIAPPNVSSVELSGYGHEAADNIALFALLAKMSIEGSGS
jgi:hypothetical protein